MSDFDDLADSWNDDAKRARATKAAKAILSAANVQSVTCALDYGCGTGLLSFALADALPQGLPHAVLMDTSSKMLEHAEREIAQRGLSWQTQRRDLSVQADDHPTQIADLAYSMLAMHHVADIATLLTNLQRTLRPGGQVVLIDLVEGSEDFHHPGQHRHHDGFSQADLEGQLTAAGFSSLAWHPPLSLTKHHHNAPDTHHAMFVASATRAPDGA